MKSSFDRQNTTNSEEIKSLESVLKVLENLFFSMPIPEEIAEKYNYLKEGKLKRVGLDYTPVTKLQYPSIGAVPKQAENTGKLQDLEDSFAQIYDDQLSLFDNIFNYVIERGNIIADTLKNNTRPAFSTKPRDLANAINELKNKITRSLKEYQIKKASMIPTEKSQSLKLAELTTKSLPEIGSQMLYKTELAQNRILSIFDTIEDISTKYEAQIKGLKNELEITVESAKVKEQNLMAEVELLRKQLSKLELNSRSEDIKNTRRYDDVVLRLKEEHIQEITRLKESNQKAIKELNDLHLNEIKDLEGKINQFKEEDKKSEELTEYVAKLENVMRTIREKLKVHYDKQRPLQTTWKDEDAKTDVEEILYTEFVLYCANKLGTDNKWLVERLAEFGKENEKLKENLSKAISAPDPQFFKELIEETRNSKVILQKYEEAHSALMVFYQ